MSDIEIIEETERKELKKIDEKIAEVVKNLRNTKTKELVNILFALLEIKEKVLLRLHKAKDIYEITDARFKYIHELFTQMTKRQSLDKKNQLADEIKRTQEECLELLKLRWMKTVVSFGV